MEQYKNSNQTLERIQQMEEYLDQILDVLSSSKQPSWDLKPLSSIIDILMDYYYNGQWLKDYEADERGEIPSNIKRGVLAEDTLYNLFIDIQDLMSENTD